MGLNLETKESFKESMQEIVKELEFGKTAHLINTSNKEIQGMILDMIQKLQRDVFGEI